MPGLQPAYALSQDPEAAIARLIKGADLSAGHAVGGPVLPPMPIGEAEQSGRAAGPHASVLIGGDDVDILSGHGVNAHGCPRLRDEQSLPWFRHPDATIRITRE